MKTAKNKKIVMLGDYGVGKTSLTRRYVESVFSPMYQSTIGVNIYKHSDTYQNADGEETTIDLIIWDIEGKPRNRSQLQNYLSGASGAVIVGDLLRDDQVEAMRLYVRDFQRVQPGRPVVFAFNKSDIANDRQHHGEEDLPRDYSTVLMRTSAADGSAVPEMFRSLADQIIRIGA